MSSNCKHYQTLPASEKRNFSILSWIYQFGPGTPLPSRSILTDNNGPIFCFKKPLNVSAKMHLLSVPYNMFLNIYPFCTYTYGPICCTVLHQQTKLTLFSQSKYWWNRLAVLICLVPNWFIHVISRVAVTNWSHRQNNYKRTNIELVSIFLL